MKVTRPIFFFRSSGIRGYIIAQLKCICGAKILTDDLIPNQTLRSTIASMLSSRSAGFSIGTGKLTSSSSSNLDDKSHSFTAPAALQGGVKQHMVSMPSIVTEDSHQVTACNNPADRREKLVHSDLQSKTEESARTSMKKIIPSADAAEAVPKPRYQNQQRPDGVTVVSGSFESKVIRSKAKKKQKTAGATRSGNTNCAEYDFHVPFGPSCYNSFEFGGAAWGSDPYNMYFMLYMPSSSYPMELYGVNGFSDLPLHAPGMQDYPVSHYRCAGY
jgi:E3 ubiquitin-protein ligase RBBP6